METITTEYLKRELPKLAEDDPRVIAFYWEAFFMANGYEDEDQLPAAASLDSGFITVHDYKVWNFPTEVFVRARFYPVMEMTDAEVGESQESGFFESGFDPRVNPGS